MDWWVQWNANYNNIAVKKMRVRRRTQKNDNTVTELHHMRHLSLGKQTEGRRIICRVPALCDQSAFINPPCSKFLCNPPRTLTMYVSYIQKQALWMQWENIKFVHFWEQLWGKGSSRHLSFFLSSLKLFCRMHQFSSNATSGKLLPALHL